MTLTRRTLLAAVPFVAFAPAIVRATSLMPVKALVDDYALRLGGWEVVGPRMVKLTPSGNNVYGAISPEAAAYWGAEMQATLERLAARQFPSIAQTFNLTKSLTSTPG